MTVDLQTPSKAVYDDKIFPGTIIGTGIKI